MGTIAISGCATGIGAASRKALESEGHTVIGIDHQRCRGDRRPRQHARGRARAIEQTLESCNGKLDRLLLCAGLGGHVGNNAMVASVNYFGAIELLDAFLPALSKGESPSGPRCLLE